MTDSASNSSVGDGGNPLGDSASAGSAASEALGGQSDFAAPFQPSFPGSTVEHQPRDANNVDSQGFDVPGGTPFPKPTKSSAGPSDISPDDLTVIAQPPSFEDKKESIALLEGRRIGHFELKQFLGGGGMGLVFRAFDAILTRSVAIKLLPREGTNPETLQRFQVEARSAARLDHPNISRVFQVGSDEACDYIIFEYVEGDNLAQLVRRIGPLPLELGLRYTFQLALALQHAYQRGVVHRDVKPANVVVTDGGKLKLIDLGLARSPKADERDASLTASGVTLGTYDYISPEQARDSRMADVRSDLYSLGCTIFFMFTGQPPYPQGTPIEKIIQHSSEKRPNPAEFRTDLPADFNAITSKLLAINPDDRYQRPAELIAELQEFATRNNVPLLGYDENVIVKKIIQKPTWAMQLVPVLIPLMLLIGFVLYLDWSDRNGLSNSADGKTFTGQSQSLGQKSPTDTRPGRSGKSGKSDKQLASQNESAKQTGQVNDNNSQTKAGIGRENSGAKSSDGSRNQKQSTDFQATNPLTPANETIFVGIPADLPVNSETNPASLVPDLQAAFDSINKDPRFKEIRIYSPTVVVRRPLSLKINTSVRIAGANGIEPLIILKPDRLEKDAMIRIRGGNLNVSGVHFRLETATAFVSEAPLILDERDSDSVSNVENPTPTKIAMFELDSVATTSFTDSSLTLVNSDEEGQRLVDGASFIRLKQNRSRESEFEMPTTDRVEVKPAITFKNVCVRGEGDLLDAPGSFPFTFAFNNGLFVSDQRMLDLGSADLVDSIVKGEIEIYLTLVTAISRLGVVRVDGESSSEYLPIRLEANQSIFNFANTASLIAHKNMPENFSREQSLMLKSVDSFFPLTSRLWTIDFNNGEIDSESLDFNAMGEWLQITGVAGSTAEVTWQNFDGLAIPPHEHTVFDYQLSGAWENNPAIRKKAGIQVSEFRPIPAPTVE